MSVKFEFYLSDADFDRITVAKYKAGEHDLTYNDYAKELIISELYRLCPKRPTEKEIDECSK